MTTLECPMCCAEIFNDVSSLENHLLDLSENIVCPLCELRFKSLRTLALHLGQGCTECEDDSGNEIGSNGAEETARSKEKKSSEQVNYLDLDVVVGSVPNSSQVEGDEEKVEKVALYSCSVCNTTFPSVEEHLKQFHQNENVLVDEDISFLNSGDVNDLSSHISESNDVNIELKEVDEDLPLDPNPVVLSSDELNTLMVVNWAANPQDYEDEGVNFKSEDESNSDADNKLIPVHWILKSDGFYYYTPNASDEFENSDKLSPMVLNPNSPFEILNNGNASENSDDYYVPEEFKKYPVATYVSVCNKDDISLNGLTYRSENKSYIFKNCRVRVITVRADDEGMPRLEDIPFTEKPPNTLYPVLEIIQDAPDDLKGMFCVMWPCSLCGLLLFHWSELSQHVCVISSKPLTCSICKAVCPTRQSLNTHYAIDHNLSRSPNGNFKCHICSGHVQTATHLHKHLIMHNKIILVKCDICDCMVQKSTYESHKQAHNKDDCLRLVCVHCNRAFKNEEELKLHSQICYMKAKTEEDNLRCTFCQSSFDDLEELRHHLISHNVPVKAHLCSHCPKSYNRLIDKVLHERVHTKSKPYSCTDCGRCFRLRTSLTSHMRIHTGERPFKCNKCDKLFRTKRLLRSHSTVHVGKLQYKCKYCNKSFRTKVKVVGHELGHKTPLYCTQCNRAFYNSSFYKKHLENHKNGKLKYTCNMCSNMFTRAAYLENHLRSVHGLDASSSISITTQKTYEHMEAQSFPGKQALQDI